MNVLVNGLLLGAGYCMVAMGLALILGVSKVFDLVYASYYTVAAYVVVFMGVGHGLPLWFSSGVAVAASIALALAVHYLLVMPIQRHQTAVLVSTFAVAMVIQELLVFGFGSEAVYLPPAIKGTTDVFGIWVANQRLLVAAVSVCLSALLWLFLAKTRLGLAIRTAAEQPEALVLAGGNLTRICLTAVTLAAAIAAVGGLLLSPTYPPSPYSWLDLLVIGFAVVVLGGLGNIWACLPAALLLGIAETAFAVYVPFGGIIKRTVGLGIILVVLVLRPSGLFGVLGWEEEG